VSVEPASIPTVSRTARLRTLVLLISLTAIAAASRLPQLRSPNLMVDGDESVLGLMATHSAQGKEFPVFFYGQRYALETVEAGVAALAFRIFGDAPLVLKESMLALWTAGVLFLFLALSRVVGQARGFWITVVLILNPMWAAWSMKAGGGYLTAFTASAVLLWLLVQDEKRDSLWKWLIAGALTGLIYLAQPLWLPGVLPIVLVVAVSRRRPMWAASYAAMTAAAIVLAKLVPGPEVDAWTGPAAGNTNLLGSLPGVARQIYVYLTGSYYLWWAIDPPGPATRAIAIVWSIALAAAVLIQLYRVLTKQYCVASHVLFGSVLATLVATWTLFNARDARYLLPLGAVLVALAGIELIDLVDRGLMPRRAAIAGAATSLLLGSLSMREFRDFNFLWTNPPTRWTEARRLQQVFGYLKVNDVSRVFCMNGMLDSQLVFYSGERVLSRWTTPVTRYPPYLQAVDRALASGERVAVVGYTHTSGAPGCWDVPICTGGLENLVPNPESIFTVDGKYFVYVGADRELLRKLGFRFWD
jgi:hypothetical protein